MTQNPLTWKNYNDFWALQTFTRSSKKISHITAPLTALTSTSTPFLWSPEAEAALKHLKSCFASAPVLIQPDPAWQFIVEVDAYDTRLGTVLSQQSSTDDKLQPCVFFYHRLSPVKKNSSSSSCQAGSRGMASLVGGCGPALYVWTDHKNLSFIQSPKCLKSRQARYFWSF